MAYWNLDDHSIPPAGRVEQDGGSEPTELEWRYTPDAEQEVFELIVSHAINLVETYSVDPFDAADWATSRYQYEDFQAVLAAVRGEMAPCTEAPQ